MIIRWLASLLTITLTCMWFSQSSDLSPAFAQSCSDIETLFARGTNEPEGIGDTGQLFVDALQERLHGRTMTVYAVDYPANHDWHTGIDGIRDASDHIQQTARQCPNTKMILSGFSQGAAIMGFVTDDSVPEGIDPDDVPAPMPASIANHVAAVVLFGTPNDRAMNFLGQPHVVIGPLYANKTLQLCTIDDPVCSEGFNPTAHNARAYSNIVDEGADFAIHQVDISSSQAGYGHHSPSSRVKTTPVPRPSSSTSTSTAFPSSDNLDHLDQSEETQETPTPPIPPESEEVPPSNEATS